MPDVIMVGGGICGLQLAALLASDGMEVVVLEKLAHLGGRAFLWEKDGFIVDNGIHLIRFGPKSATAKVFQRLGRPLPLVNLGTNFVAFPEGRVVELPLSNAKLAEGGLISAEEAKQARELFRSLQSQDPRELLETSVAEWMDRWKIGGGLRHYFHLVSAAMQVCPFLARASAGEMLLNLGRAFAKGYPAMYPAQGWGYIYEVLIEAIKAKGEVRTGARVRKVVVEQGRAKGVELESGERLTADRVVINLPCQQLFEVLDQALVPAEFAALCKGLQPTAGLSIDYGLNRRVSEDRGLWYLWEPMSFGIFTSNLCPELAPPGKQLLTWFMPADVADMKDPGRAQAIESALERAIFQLFPELEPAVEWRRALRLTMVDGAEVNTSQHRNRRPGYRVPGIDGLFLVGDSLKAPGAGGDIGHESVLRAYQEITGKRLEL